RDDDQQKSVLYSLQEIGIVQDVGIVVGTDAIIGLGSKIVALLQRIDENVDQRVYHEKNQENERRQQIQPGFFILVVHLKSSIIWKQSGFSLRSAYGTERPFRASEKNARYGRTYRSVYPR